MGLNIEKVNEESLYTKIFEFVKTFDDGTIVTIDSITNHFLENAEKGKYKAVEVKNEVNRLFNSLTEYGKFIRIGSQLVTNFKGKAEEVQIKNEDIEK